MSNDRLRIKLTATRYDEESVLAMEREVMMTTYAEVVATNRPKPAVVGYDPAIERERLVFERERSGKLTGRSGRLREKIGCVQSRRKRRRNIAEN